MSKRVKTTILLLFHLSLALALALTFSLYSLLAGLALSISATFTKQSFREKIVFASSAVSPATPITHLHPRVSQTYVTTDQWGIEVSSNAAEDISNEYQYGEGETKTAFGEFSGTINPN